MSEDQKSQIDQVTRSRVAARMTKLRQMLSNFEVCLNFEISKFNVSESNDDWATKLRHSKIVEASSSSALEASKYAEFDAIDLSLEGDIGRLRRLARLQNDELESIKGNCFWLFLNEAAGEYEKLKIGECDAVAFKNRLLVLKEGYLLKFFSHILHDIRLAEAEIGCNARKITEREKRRAPNTTSFDFNHAYLGEEISSNIGPKYSKCVDREASQKIQDGEANLKRKQHG